VLSAPEDVNGISLYLVHDINVQLKLQSSLDVRRCSYMLSPGSHKAIFCLCALLFLFPPSSQLSHLLIRR
jgi:hypothetical protein